MEQIKEWLIPCLIHLLYFVGVVYLVGFLIFLLNKLFYKLLGGGRFVCYVTGLVGTPIHELSHALMCLLFGHRIVEIRLFRVDQKSGVLGYVTHAYSKRNLYHVLGNYFIGVAPILLGTAFLCLMMHLLLPTAFVEFQVYLSDFADWQAMGYVPEQLLGVGAVFVSFLTILFSAVSQGWVFWAFLALALCVSIHMNLSGADILGSLGSLPIIFILLSLCHAVLFYMTDTAYPVFVRGLNLAGAYLAGVLMLALFLSLMSVVAAFVVWLIKRPFTR